MKPKPKKKTRSPEPELPPFKSVRGVPVETAIGHIYPSLKADKTYDGDEINAGVMFMTMYGGEATLDGEKFNVTTVINGTRLVITAEANGRRFVTDIEKLIRHAIAYGLTNPKLRFVQDTKKEKDT